MKTSWIGMAAGSAVFMALTAPAYAVQECKPGKADPRICYADYNPENVLRIWGTLRSLTMIQFGPDETNPRMGAANNVDLKFWADGNTFFIKPLPVPSEAWNINPIIIQTTLKDGRVRSYSIEYDLRNSGSLTETDAHAQFVVKYKYPGDVAAAQLAAWRVKQAAEREEQAKAILASGGPGSKSGMPGYACDYVEQHDPKHPLNFIPTEVCDDGNHTYMRFPGNMPVPTLTVDGPDGKPMVPMQGFDSSCSCQVIYQVVKHYYLRIGDALDCIWKTQPHDPAGFNTGTGTVSKDVVREVKGGGGEP